jgi:PhzF family phenazine biosynthesis protein
LIVEIVQPSQSSPAQLSTMPRTHCFGVDAFASQPFSGNPAAVCLMDEVRDAKWMQAIAAEMNLSETAFVRPLGLDYELRWFTPAVEVDLCGHATLASAHVLWPEGLVRQNDPIRFSTRSGILTAAHNGGHIELDFPAIRATEASPPSELIDALGVVPSFVGRSKFDYLVVVETAKEVRTVCPDFGKLASVEVRGTIVTSMSDDSRFDFISRFFAPAAGVNEDPVTGSAHCCLGPFWKEKLGKETMIAYQASARGGVVRVCAGTERVILGGKAVTVWRGELSDLASS